MQRWGGLAKLLEEDADRLARRWARVVESEASDRAGTARKELREPLAQRVDDLVRLLKQHGAEAPRLFAEVARPHGGLRFEQRFTASDVVREFHALGALLITSWQQKHGSVPADVALFVLDLAAAGAAGAVDDYVRRLREGRAHLRETGAIESIVRHLAEGLIAVERDGTISFVTPPVARILGMPEQRLVGRGVTNAEALVRELRVRDEQGRPLLPAELPFAAALASGKPSPTRWLRIHRPSDDRERVVETDAFPFHERGELRGVVQTIRDRTEEFRQREALSRAYDALRRLHLRLLRRSRREALGEVSAGVIGALKNLMNTARLRSRLAVDQGTPAEVLAPIESAIDEMAETVTRLQRLLARRVAGAVENVRLDEIAREAIDLVRPELSASARGRGVRVEVSLASQAEVRAGRTELFEVIVLLLLGATDALPNQGTLFVESTRAGDRAKLVVRGAPGVAAREEVDGLAATVQAWGGRFSLDAERGEAALDLEVAPRAAAAEPEPPGVATEPARSVLVVDDDADNREALAAVLRASGLRVEQAGSFAEAHAAMERRSFDAALVDLAMPDGSGRELAAQLLERDPALRVALVTGYEPGGAEGERTPTFTKPIDVARLLQFLGASA